MRRGVINAFVLVLCIAANCLCACDSKSRNGWFLTMPEARLVVSPEQDLYKIGDRITFTVEWDGVVSSAVDYQWDFGNWAYTDDDLSSASEEVWPKLVQGEKTARVLITDGTGEASRFNIELEKKINIDPVTDKWPDVSARADGCYITGTYDYCSAWTDYHDVYSQLSGETDKGGVLVWGSDGGCLLLGVSAWFWDFGDTETIKSGSGLNVWDRERSGSFISHLLFDEIAKSISETRTATVTLCFTTDQGVIGKHNVPVEYDCPTLKPLPDSIFLKAKQTAGLYREASIDVFSILSTDNILKAVIRIDCVGIGRSHVSVYDGDYFSGLSHLYTESYSIDSGSVSVEISTDDEFHSFTDGGKLGVLSFSFDYPGMKVFSIDPENTYYYSESSGQSEENRHYWSTVGMEDKDGNIVNSVSVDVVE